MFREVSCKLFDDIWFNIFILHFIKRIEGEILSETFEEMIKMFDGLAVLLRDTSMFLVHDTMENPGRMKGDCGTLGAC